MIKAVIVEDNPVAQEYLRNLLSSYPGILIAGTASGIDEAIEIIARTDPDLLFLDVELKGETGFDLIHQLLGLDVHPAVIFVTGHEKYAIEAIRHAAFDFLLKPIDPFELKQSLERYYANSSEDWRKKVERLIQGLDSQKKIALNVRSGVLYLDPSEILYCEADGNYTVVVTGEKRKEYITLQLGQIEKRLDMNVFVRISRSLLVNRNYISLIDRTKKQVIFSKGENTVSLSLTLRQIRELSSFLKV
jgi:two-component system, LytTR family, response regulator